MHIDFSAYSRIVVLTGAGISVASGLRPYRGPGGVWEEADIARLAHADAVANSPADVWRAFGPMRETILRAEPNPAHSALAQFERSLRPHQNLLVVTQNIDGLHTKAGSRSVVEIHGNMLFTRCSDERCKFPRTYDEAMHKDSLPKCPVCTKPLRPDVVFFGEYPDAEASWTVKRALRDCDLFLAIGTSGVVSPASEFVRSADYAGARTVFINIEPLPAGARYFREQIVGRAEELLPSLLRVGA
jgi:NAD-dependent deacetylase